MLFRKSEPPLRHAGNSVSGLIPDLHGLRDKWWPRRWLPGKRKLYLLSRYDIVALVSLAVFRASVYVPAEEQWRRSLLELPGSLPGGLDQVFPPETRLNQPGRAFARGVVLEPTTKSALCEFDFVVFLCPRSGLSSLFPPGVCSRTPRLAGCRDKRRVG